MGRKQQQTEPPAGQSADEAVGTTDGTYLLPFGGEDQQVDTQSPLDDPGGNGGPLPPMQDPDERVECICTEDCVYKGYIAKGAHVELKVADLKDEFFRSHFRRIDASTSETERS